MSWFKEAFRRARAMVNRDDLDQESREEFAFHIEQEAKRLQAEGMAPDEALRKARAAFGSQAATLDYTRDARGARLLEEAYRDLRLTLRQLRRQAGFSVTVVLTIALGIGAVTAIWSVVDGVLLRPAPVNLERLAMIWQTDRASGTVREPASWPDFEDVRDGAQSFNLTTTVSGLEPTLLGEDGETARVRAMATTPSYFELFSVEPVLGRFVLEREAVRGGPRVAVLGEQLWRERFEASTDVLGTMLVLDDEPYEVVGVAPDSADFGLDQIHARAAYHSTFNAGGHVHVWLPIQTNEEASSRDSHPYLVAGRLRPGVDLTSAQSEMASLAADLEATYPRSNADRGMFVEALDQVIFAPVRPVLWLLTAGVALLMVVAFVNVTSLLLARGATRGREVAVRAALGAGIGRIGRQILVENAVLTALGAGLGVAMAFGLLPILIGLAPTAIPRVAEVGVDARVLMLTVGVSIVSVLLFSLVPVLQARRVRVQDAMLGGSRGATAGPASRRTRLALVVGEFALSVALVVFAGLLVRSLSNVLEVDPGFQAKGVLKAQYQLPQSRYPRDFSRWPDLSEIHGFNARLISRVEALPGVASAAIAGSHPLDPGFTNSFQIVGREEESRDLPEISVRSVSPGYFSTLGLQLIEGRPLSSSDGTQDDPVVVLNHTAAQRLFEGRLAIGQHLRFWGTERRVIGVVADERIKGPAEAAPIALYAPLEQMPMHTGVLLVRATSGDEMELADEVSAAVLTEDPGLAVFGVERLEETLAGTFRERRFAMLVVTVMAAVTVLLSLFGIYGVLSYSVAQRRREMGIRTALGATRVKVAGLVIRNGLSIAAAGVAIGMLIAIAGSRYVSQLLFQVAAVDPLTYFVVAAAGLMVAAVASSLPALRAARVEVVEALRNE